MSTESIPVIKFVFEKDWKILDQAMGIKPVYSAENYSNAAELNTFLSTAVSSLVLCSLVSKNDLVQIASLVKLNKKLSNAPVLKIVVINFSKNREFEKALSKLGIMDIIETNVNIKSLRYKLDFFIKSITAQLKKNNAKELMTKASKSTDSSSNDDNKKEDFSKVNWVEELDAPEDIWLIAQDGDCKKILNKWLLKIMGPSPYVGQWVEVPRQKGIWRFELKAETKHFLLEGEGSWFFKGDQKPEFVWKENRWLVTGWAFELFFEDKSQRVSRLLLKDKVMTVAKNSMYADTKKDIIIQSFDKELLFTKDAETSEENAFKNDKLLNKNLEGNAKTDQLELDPLSGKGKTSEINNKPLSMELNEGDQKITDKPLEQKGETSKKSTFWKGQNSSENPLSDNMDGPAGKNNLNSENLEQEMSDQDVKSHYKGMHSKDDNEKKKQEDFSVESTKAKTGEHLTQDKKTEEVEAHYKNKMREAKGQDQKKKEKKDGEKENEKDEGKSLSSVTDKVKKAKQLDLEQETEDVQTHYKNHNPVAKDKDKEEKDLSSVASEKLRKGKQLDLEQETEEVETHYKGHNPVAKESEQKKKEKEQAAKNKEKEEQDLSSPASEKIRKGKQLDLEQETEEVETHYKGHNPVAKESEQKKKEKEQAAKNKEKEEQDLSSPASEKIRKGKQLDLKQETEDIQTHYKTDKKKNVKGSEEEETLKKDARQIMKKNKDEENGSELLDDLVDFEDLSSIEAKTNDKENKQNRKENTQDKTKKKNVDQEESIFDDVIGNKFSKNTTNADLVEEIEEDPFGDLSETRIKEEKKEGVINPDTFSQDTKAESKKAQKTGNDEEEDLYKKDKKDNNRAVTESEFDNGSDGKPKKVKSIPLTSLEALRKKQDKEEGIETDNESMESEVSSRTNELASDVKKDKTNQVKERNTPAADNDGMSKDNRSEESTDSLLKSKIKLEGMASSTDNENQKEKAKLVSSIAEMQKEISSKEIFAKRGSRISFLIDKLYERDNSGNKDTSRLNEDESTTKHLSGFKKVIGE